MVWMGLCLAWMPATSQAAEPGPVPMLALEARLAQEGGRLDERIGVLLRAHEDPDLTSEAAVRLRSLLLDAPPRAAWAQAYQVAGSIAGTPSEPIALLAAAAALQQAAPPASAWTTLEAMAQADAPGARQHLGQALLFHGRVEDRAPDLVPPLERAWLALAAGRTDEAVGTLTAVDAQPCLETDDDLTCGGLLLSLGWPGAARARAGQGLAKGPDPGLEALVVRAEDRLLDRPGDALVAAASELAEAPPGGDPGAHFDRLLEACDRWPTRWEVLGPTLALAFELDRPEVAERLVRSALSHARTPDTWASLLQDLGRVTAAAAEASKARGDLVSAVGSLQLAHVLLPEDGTVLTSLAGTTWQLGQPEAAVLAYEAAAVLLPEDAGLLGARFRLFLALDRLQQAADLLASRPPGDPDIDALRQELALEQAIRSVRAQLAAGDVAGAQQGVARLRQRFDGWSAVQALAGDVHLAAGEPRQAAEAYERARLRDPADPWTVLGEARALGALQHWREAHLLLEGLDPRADTEVAAAAAATREHLLREEGDHLRDSGAWDEAWARYERLLDGDPDPWTLTGAGALYLATERPDDALAAYEQALARDPDNAVAARGRVWALLAAGRALEAEEAAQALVEAGRDPANDALLAQVQRTRQLLEARVLRFSGRPGEAEDLLLRALETWPGDPELTLALGWLLEQEGRPAEAWWKAREVLTKDPTHAEALALLRTVGRGRATAVHRAWKDAVEAGAEPELAAALPALRLAIELERAEDMARRGLQASARELVTRASQDLAGGDGAAWSAVGDAWTALGDLDRAWAAYELALAHAPSDPFAAQRLAGCLEARGRAGHAQRVLDLAWSNHGDPRVGLALAQLQERRGLLRQASRTREALVAVAARSGGTIQAPADEAGLPLAVAGAAGVTWLHRPGQPGREQLDGWLTPVAAAVGLPGHWQVEAQAVPYRLSDGVAQDLGGSLSFGVATRPGTPLALRARLGSGPVGGGSWGRWTWDATLAAPLGDRGEVGLGFHRATVLDSLSSWQGATDVLGQPFGAVEDTWVSGLVSLRWPPATDFGLLARAGVMSGDAVAPVAWQQLVGWGHRALRPTDDRLRIGLEGLLASHERRSDRFDGGEAAAFTPTRFGQLTGRLEGTWTHAEQPLRVCGGLGAGPQYQDGETLRFADPGWAVTGDAVLAAQWRFLDPWLVEGRVWAQATSSRWHQEVVLLSLQRREAVTVPVPAVGPFASPVHGPPLVPHRPCATVREGASW